MILCRDVIMFDKIWNELYTSKYHTVSFSRKVIQCVFFLATLLWLWFCLNAQHGQRTLRLTLYPWALMSLPCLYSFDHTRRSLADGSRMCWWLPASLGAKASGSVVLCMRLAGSLCCGVTASVAALHDVSRSWQINSPAASSLRGTILTCVVCSVKSFRGFPVGLCPAAHSWNLLINTPLIASFPFFSCLYWFFTPPYKLLAPKYPGQLLRQYTISSLK